MTVSVIKNLNLFRKNSTCEDVAGRLGAFRFPAIGTYLVAGDRKKFLFMYKVKILAQDDLP